EVLFFRRFRQDVIRRQSIGMQLYHFPRCLGCFIEFVLLQHRSSSIQQTVLAPVSVQSWRVIEEHNGQQSSQCECSNEKGKTPRTASSLRAWQEYNHTQRRQLTTPTSA